MTHRILALGLSFLAGLTPASAVDANPPGEFAGYVAIGSSPDYIEDWHRPVKGRAAVVPLLKEFAIGETAYIAFLVTGVLGNDAGKADVTVDFLLITPEGTFMFDEKEYSKVTGPASREPCIVMADPAVDITFEPGDPVGRYSLVAIFHDLVSKKGALAEIKINVRQQR